MPKCNCCIYQTTDNQAVWAWQPFGPGGVADTFTTLGSHYRGYPVVKVCDGCKKKLQSGESVKFSHKRRHYVIFRGLINEVREYGYRSPVAGESTIR